MSHDLTFRPPPAVVRGALILAGLGAVSFAVGAWADAASTWASLLLIAFAGIGMGLSGAVFIALQYVTAAGWSAALRRVPEAMCALLIPSGILLLAVLLLYPDLYPWAAHGVPHAPFQDAWLNRPFFLARAAFYLLVWFAMLQALIRNSLRQDEDGAPAHTRRNQRLAALFLVVFAVTFWLASHDWIMSLEPDWASTVFGLYNFAGLFLAGLAALACLVIWLQRLGPFRHVLTSDHLHDLGKLLFAFSTFWMYIWFCQYMLIWYVNNPEETSYYLRRLHGAWQPLFWLNVALNWLVPFLVLLPRATKRNPSVLLKVSLVVLAGRWLDLCLMILPAVEEELTASIVTGMALSLGAAGLFVLVFFHALGKAALVPRHDPFLVESLPAAAHRLDGILPKEAL